MITPKEITNSTTVIASRTTNMPNGSTPPTTTPRASGVTKLAASADATANAQPSHSADFSDTAGLGGAVGSVGTMRSRL